MSRYGFALCVIRIALRDEEKIVSRKERKAAKKRRVSSRRGTEKDRDRRGKMIKYSDSQRSNQSISARLFEHERYSLNPPGNNTIY